MKYMSNLKLFKPPVGLTVSVAVMLVTGLIGLIPFGVKAAGPSSWPSTWTTPNSCVADLNDESPAEADIIGSAGTPAVGFYSDGYFQYFRERLRGNPGSVNNLKNSAWVVLFQVSAPNYQYLASVNGDNNKVQLWQNTTISGAIDFNPVFHDQAETKLWEGNSADYARVTSSGGAYYIDWAIPVSELTSRGIVPTTTKYFATSQTSSNYNKDYLNCYVAIADVTVSKVASANSVNLGDNLTYTITAYNGGPESASSVVVTDVLPGNVSYVSHTASVGTYNSGTGVWNIGTLANNVSATLTIVVVVNSGSSVTNTATISSSTTDSNDSNNTATVITTVNAPPNNPPVAVNDAYSTNEDTVLNVSAVGVLTNDTDADNDPLTAVLVSGPTHGSLTLNSDGSFTYTPNADFNGADSFTYKANDGTANSIIATVDITVTPVNDPPVANNDAYSTPEDIPLVMAASGVLNNDTDIDSGSLTAIQVSGPSNGTLNLNADGSFTYTPNLDFNGTDSFTYKANDGSLESNVATVTITVTDLNDTPVANNDSYTTTEDTPLVEAASGVLGNDTDTDADPLTAILVAGPTNGSLTLNTDGSFTYTPNLNFNGTDTSLIRLMTAPRIVVRLW